MTKEELNELSKPPLKRSIFDRIMPITDEHKALRMMRDSKTPDEQERVVLSLSDKLRNNSYVMGELTAICPRASLYVGEELQGEGFLKSAMFKNPNVYFVLPEEQRAKEEIFDLYRWSCMFHSQNPDSSIDKQKFYSVEAYEHAFRTIFQDGWKERVGYHDYVYRDEVRFVWKAEAENPTMAQQYQEARSAVVREDMNRLCELATQNVDGFRETWSDELRKACPKIVDKLLRNYYEYGDCMCSKLDEHVKKYDHQHSQASELPNREVSTTDERVSSQQDITRASEKESRHVLEESFGRMIPADLDQENFKRVFAEEIVYSGKHVVVISAIDFNKITQLDNNQKEYRINAADIGAGMECHLPCTGMELYTGQEDSYGHYTSPIINAVFDGQDLAIETEGMIYTTVDLTEEFIEAAKEVADRIGIRPEQLVPAMDKLEAIVAEAEYTGPVIGDDD